MVSSPVNVAWELAANAPASSWRTWTKVSSGWPRMPSTTAFMASPGTPTTWRTPASASTASRTSVTVMAMMTPDRCRWVERWQRISCGRDARRAPLPSGSSVGRAVHGVTAELVAAKRECLVRG